MRHIFAPVAIVLSLFGASIFAAESTSTVRSAPQLIGGTIADPLEWPASPWVGNCSSTLIGERVLLVAAHCTGNGGTKSFTIGSTIYSAKCDHHTSYSSNSTADWALCLITNKVEGVPFESIATSEEASCNTQRNFLLTGYGCRQWNGGIDGKFRTGTAKATSCPSSGNYDTTTRGLVALCSGDSGGGAYAVMTDGSRRVIGVNSRSNTVDTSYISSTYSSTFRTWAESWASARNVRICGVHADAPHCKKPTNPDVDCTAEEGRLASAQVELGAAQTALSECRASFD